MHEDDLDAVPLSKPIAINYARRTAELAVQAPQPSLTAAYGADRGQRLDVYAPSAASDLPVLLFFHGGAWIAGHLGWNRFMAQAVNSIPALFVSSTYRLAPRCRWPAQIEDARGALQWVADNVRDFGGDPRQIVIGGHSAGGHLASLVALGSDRSPIIGCMPVSSSFDLRYGDVPAESEEGRVYKYLLADRTQDCDASPVTHVPDGAKLPFHIVWGERDLGRVQASGKQMVAALKQRGSPVTCEIIPEATHFDTHLALADSGNSWYERFRNLTAAEDRIGEFQ